MQTKRNWIASGAFCLLFIAEGMSLSGVNTVTTLWVMDVNKPEDSITIPCGDNLDLSDNNVSLTYYVHDTGNILAETITEELTVQMSASYEGKHICCNINGLSNNIDSAEDHCYHIMESYAPRRVNRAYIQPVYGQYYEMECPLEGSPPTNYIWKKYETIDKTTESNFSTDVHFENGGRMWYVAEIREEHSGMYTCSAVNAKGEMMFEDTVTFYLDISACPYHAPEISVQISSPSSSDSSVMSYSVGDRVHLVCTAMAADRYEEPFWYHNGIACTGKHYVMNNTFDKSACRWMKELIIPEFSRNYTGLYQCTIYQYGANTTLHLNRESDSQYMIIMNTLVPVITWIILRAIILFYNLVNNAAKQIKFLCSKEPPYDGFIYDAFISAHDEAKHYVLENLLPSLETCQHPYRLCWHSRNFLPGIPIMEQIARTMAESRKIIFVFSEHFTESEFCRVELELALNRYMKTSIRCILPITLAGGCVVPSQLRQTITYLPIISAQEMDVTKKIAQVMGVPIPIDMDRLNDSFVDE